MLAGMNALKTLKVELGERSYPIFVGEGLLSNPDYFSPYVAGKKVMVVSNETVSPLYLEQLMKALCDSEVDEVALPDGEQHKNWQTLNQIFDALLTKQHSRKTTIVALGGGVVGDMAGFAAAAYQRGVEFIQVPTTLLSQVDSSVGGKTAINHELGKNMIGAFHQPKAVVIDISTLRTLASREVSAGIAEVIKYGLIADEAFFSWLESHIDKLMSLDTQVLTEAIAKSCRCKADIVAADEKEQGKRALLNLGHTFGHAIETHMGYGRWLHGEAVAAGMMMAGRLSVMHGWLAENDLSRMESLLSKANLPVSPPSEMTESDFMSHMRVDKKVMDGSIRLVLMESLGRAIVTDKYDPNLLSQLLNSQTKP